MVGAGSLLGEWRAELVRGGGHKVALRLQSFHRLLIRLLQLTVLVREDDAKAPYLMDVEETDCEENSLRQDGVYNSD